MQITSIETNIPLEAWLELPQLRRWAVEAIAAFENGIPFQRQMNFKLNLIGSGGWDLLAIMSVSLDFPHRHQALFSISDRNLPFVEQWLTRLSPPPSHSTPSNLMEVLYGRNRNSTPQNHGSSPLGASGGAGRAQAGVSNAIAALNSGRAAGKGAGLALLQNAFNQNVANQLMQSIQGLGQLPALAPLFPELPLHSPAEQKHFPLTEQGKASLAEAIAGALPNARLLQESAARHRELHKLFQLQLGRSPHDNGWGSPPDDTKIHIQQGEIIARRIWFTSGLTLRSIHQPTSWQPGEIISGNVKKNGVFAFRAESFALPLLYCYIRDISQILTVNELYGRQQVLHPQRDVQGIAMGTVKLWGDVVEHQYGYRAQFARLHSIDECSIPELLPILQRKYFPPQSTEEPSVAPKTWRKQ